MRSAPPVGSQASASFLAALLLAAPVAHAQRVTGQVTLSVDHDRVAVGETLRLEVEADVTGEHNPRVDPPDLSAFEVVGRQSSNQFSLGAQVRAVTTYYFTLRARVPGNFQIGPAHAYAGNRTFESNTVEVKVEGSAGTTSAEPPPPNAVAGADALPFDPNGFVRISADVAEPYVGQQVTVTVKLYLSRGLAMGPTITQEPSTDGFWTFPLLPPSRNLSAELETVRGTVFQVYVLRRFAAFPLRSGALTIGATNVSVPTGGGLFAIFGGGSPPIERASEPLALHVRELPEQGRPAGLVHVGSLSLNAELDRTQVATGDAVTLRVRAQGTGQMQQLRLADPHIDGLRVLAPEVHDDAQSPNDVVGGTRTYEWLVVPEREGRYTIPPFSVAAFDPRAGTYASVTTNALTLAAAGNPIVEPPASTDGAPAASSDTRSPAPSFGPLRTRATLARSQASLPRAGWFPWALSLPPLAFVLAALGIVLQRRRRASAAGAPKRDVKSAQKRLRGAEALLDEPAPFYAAITQALQEMVEAKLGHAVGSLTHTELRQTLLDRGLAAEPTDQLLEELTACDFARFSAAGASREEMQRCLERAQGILSALDRFTPSGEVAA